MNYPKRGGGTSSSSSGDAPVEKAAAAAPDNTITGKFDPSSLERGVKALKELDASPNASKAFELLKLQETTKQQEAEAEMATLNNSMAQAQMKRQQIEQEEKRRTTSHQQEQERKTAEYKAQLEAELYNQKLEDQQKQIDEQLQRQHQQFAHHEELRQKSNMQLEEAKRQTMTEQAALDRDTAVAKAKAESQGRIDQERQNVEVRLREMRARMAEERKTRMEQVQAIMGGLGAGSKALLEDNAKMTALVGGLTALAVGVYTARAGTRVIANIVERNLMRPPLVRDTSRFTWSRDGIVGALRRPFAQKEANVFENIVLQDELEEQLKWTTNSLINAKANGTPFRHLLLHGPPGTGKTLFARTLAKQSGLDYAIMSGGDVGPLGKDAVHELNKLFSWANSSRKGLILFIDEAEAFLRTGRGSGEGRAMSEEARNVLSAFLHHTGTESDKFCVVMATNIRGILDRAVIDRVDESFEFPLPSLPERKRMLQMFMDEHIHAPTRKGKVIVVDEQLNEEWLHDVAVRTEGMSGRQLAKLVLAYQAAVFGSGTTRLSKGLTEAVLQYKLEYRDTDEASALLEQDGQDSGKANAQASYA